MSLSKPIAVVLLAIAVLTASGQVPQKAEPLAGSAVMLAPPKGGMVTMHLEDAMDDAPVKGTPFCATITIEHTQSFVDGNRIHTSDDSTLCRDSEGRTRREASLNLLGANPERLAPKLITIVDPVAHVRYMLDPENKVAHKMKLASSSLAGGSGDPLKGEHTYFYQKVGSPGPAAPPADVLFRKIGGDSDEPVPTTEDLGDQTINGLRASGTRMTTKIASGKMGNDKPIIVTSERWYSPDLKATVMTKHNDPWAGELKTEFNSVNTSEPDPSLFTVPGDYRIVDDKNGPFKIQTAAPPSPTQ
jgi:hypothetical protein